LRDDLSPGDCRLWIDRWRRFRRRAAVPFCLPSPAAVLSLFYRASIAFAAPVDGWLLHSPPTQQHTDHITKPKTFPVPTPQKSPGEDFGKP
jgi:hypothetical protein